jgi:hypothetical protein
MKPGHKLKIAAGVIFISGVGYQLISLVKNQQELIESLQEDLDVQKEIIGIKEKTITSANEWFELNVKGLKSYFPEFVNAEEIGLSDLEKKLFEDELALPSIDESKIWDNLCVYERYYFHDETFIGSFGGNCIFVAPNIVLTNRHVALSTDMDDFYSKVGRVSVGELEFFAKEIFAVSPRYDLALVRVDNNYPKFNKIPIGVYDDSKPLVLYTCGNGDFSCSGEFPLRRDLTLKERFLELILTQNGTLSFPSLEINEIVEPGYSGSPVFSDGKLVGLVAQNTDDGSFVTDHVYEFITNVVNAN